jgi:folate-binding protein YgfZ
MHPLSVEGLHQEVTAHGAWTREHGLRGFEVKGKDGLDLLHRLSTNDLLTGGIPRSKRTVLTTEKGRVVDLVEVVVTGDRTFLIVHAGAAGEVREWVERFVILEEVELTPITDDRVIVWFIGPQFESGARLHPVLPESAPSAAPHMESWRSPLGRIPAYRGIISADRLQPLLAALNKAGCQELHRDAFDLLRIMTGTPAYPNELNASVNPLEVNLRHVVSFTKGCYVGQEVVARLDAYEKVQRELHVLHLMGVPGSAGGPLHVIVDDHAAGAVTSVSAPLSDGTTLALALCRKDAMASKGALTVRAENERNALRAQRFDWSEIRGGGAS